jgi:hypothetical protein
MCGYESGAAESAGCRPSVAAARRASRRFVVAGPDAPVGTLHPLARVGHRCERRRPRPGPGRAARRPQRLELCRKAGLSTRATGRRPSRARARGQPRRPLAKEHARQPASRVGRMLRFVQGSSWDSSARSVPAHEEAARLTREVQSRPWHYKRSDDRRGRSCAEPFPGGGCFVLAPSTPWSSFHSPSRAACGCRVGTCPLSSIYLAEDSLTLRWAVC